MTRRSLAVMTAAAVVAVGFIGAAPAGAAIVPAVPLGTAGAFSVLAGSTITNTGPTIIGADLGLSPGTAVTGFPPGIVNGTAHVTDAVAAQAKSDLTAAYVNAAGRPLNATTTADLANLTLVGGVYAGPSKGALALTGPLTLDGAGDATSVFIFQTSSTLTTGAGSTVSLINGAQACNVFWQVGSSATLGTSSHLVGTILALTSITVTTGATVNGRALTRNAAVTLDSNTFTTSGCAAPQQVTSTTSSSTTSTSTSTTSTSTTSTTRPPTTTSSLGAATPPTIGIGPTASDGTVGSSTTIGTGPFVATPTVTVGGGVTPSTTPDGRVVELPRTGPLSAKLLVLALVAIALGAGAVHLSRSGGPRRSGAR